MFDLAAVAIGGCDDLEGCLEVGSWFKGEVSPDVLLAWLIAPASADQVSAEKRRAPDAPSTRARTASSPSQR